VVSAADPYGRNLDFLDIYDAYISSVCKLILRRYCLANLLSPQITHIIVAMGRANCLNFTILAHKERSATFLRTKFFPPFFW
jgi:hypothetical protein